MARPVYSTRFIHSQGLDGTATYLVPDGFRAVVRDADFFWVEGLTGASVNLLVVAGSVLTTIAYQRWAPDTDTQSVKSWRGRQVLEPGEALSCSTSSALDCTVSGYLLSLP